jgi:hypothetical protein
MMRRQEQTARLFGSENFVVKLEKILDKILRQQSRDQKLKKDTKSEVRKKKLWYPRNSAF